MVFYYYATSLCRAPNYRPHPTLAVCILEILGVSQVLESQAPNRSVILLFILDESWHPAIIYNILPWEPGKKSPKNWLDESLEHESVLGC